MKKRTQQEIYKSINEILWFDWDPIRVNNVAPRNEYENYTQTIFGLKLSCANQEIIALKLHEIETEIIGVIGDLERCREIAKKIYDLE